MKTGSSSKVWSKHILGLSMDGMFESIKHFNLLILFSISDELKFDGSTDHQCQQPSSSHTGHKATSSKKLNWTSVEMTQEAVGWFFDDGRRQEDKRHLNEQLIGPLNWQ